MIIAKSIHILGFTVWIGGMFFATMALRPVAASLLEPAQRLPLLAGVFGRFFPWVGLCVLLILASGGYLMAMLGRPSASVGAMSVIGILMMAIFAHIFFAPYRRLRRAVAHQDWKAGAAALGQLRTLIGINLVLGLITLAIGALGPLFS